MLHGSFDAHLRQSRFYYHLMRRLTDSETNFLIVNDGKAIDIELACRGEGLMSFIIHQPSRMKVDYEKVEQRNLACTSSVHSKLRQISFAAAHSLPEPSVHRRHILGDLF